MVVRLIMYSLFLVLSYICFCRLYVNGSGPTVTKIFESCTQISPAAELKFLKEKCINLRSDLRKFGCGGAS